MPTFSESIEINASPDHVWAVLGDLASVDRWIPGVTAVAVGRDEPGLHVRRRAHPERADP